MADIKQIKTPDGVTHDIRDDSKLPLAGGILTGILYTTASTPLLIGKNGKIGLRAATADKSNVGQINISNAWYGNGNQYGSQISAYNGDADAYNELRVSHNGLEYNCQDGNTYTIYHSGNLNFNNITIPVASSTAVGGIKTGYTASGKNYPVVLDDEGKAYVNVPWTDTNTDTNTWRPVKVNSTNLLTDSTSALNFSAAGFATVSGSSGTVTFDTKIRKVASVAEATDTSCVYLIPSSNGNLQQSYIIASSAPADTTKIWVDSANSNIAKVWNGSAWSTLGSVWS